MDVFTALADPTRRSILELLADRGQAAASEIFEHFSVSQPAISQHLKALRDANLVTVEKQAQRRIYRLNSATLSELEIWLHRFTERVNERYERLDQLLAQQSKENREQ